MSSTSGKGHDSRAIANIFVGQSHQANRKLTIMQLVKLVYIAHGWTLGWTGEPLIRDKIEAWRFGPVVPLVYKTFRPQGIIIRSPAIDGKGQPYFTDKVDKVELEIIGNVYKEYSKISSYMLSKLTHGKDTPWSQYDGKHYHTIKNEDIKRYYDIRVERVRNSSAE